MNAHEIKKLFEKFGADISKDDVWSVQSATVIKHAALERLAAAAKIEFEAPVIIRCERDEAVILATGKLDNRREWSIGEALVNSNYRVVGKMAAYPYAMAEKRAKDRVIIKLAGLHGIYSEDEADEFKGRSEKAESVQSEADGGLLTTSKETARQCLTKAELRTWCKTNYPGLEKALRQTEYAELKRFITDELAPNLPENNTQEAA